MNKNVLLMLLTVITVGCGKSGKDLVSDYEPREVHTEGFYAFLDRIERAPSPEVAAETIQEMRHWLDRKVILHARHDGAVPKDATIDSLVYYRGSARKAVANDGRDLQNTGHFDDQLVAYIYSNGGSTPVQVLVRCMNGLFEVIRGGKFDRLTASTNVEFTIAKGEGLLHHVGDYRTAVRIAGLFNLPLYRGRVQSTNNLITFQDALELEDHTDLIQVTVRVLPGDHFNLNTMTMTRNGRIMTSR